METFINELQLLSLRVAYQVVKSNLFKYLLKCVIIVRKSYIFVLNLYNLQLQTLYLRVTKTEGTYYNCKLQFKFFKLKFTTRYLVW